MYPKVKVYFGQAKACLWFYDWGRLGKVEILPVVSKMDTCEGWTPHVYYTMLYFCIFKKIYWAHFWEKLGNQSKRVCQGKGLNTGFSTEVQWLVTWDQALFSFHFKNNIPAGKAEF